MDALGPDFQAQTFCTLEKKTRTSRRLNCLIFGGDHMGPSSKARMASPPHPSQRAPRSFPRPSSAYDDGSTTRQPYGLPAQPGPRSSQTGWFSPRAPQSAWTTERTAQITPKPRDDARYKARGARYGLIGPEFLYRCQVFPTHNARTDNHKRKLNE